jgi:threonine dehydrogenase-like Zn-dependent dehydrogenase
VLGAYLPGNREVDVREVPDPRPGPGQVVVGMRASTICGSDLRAIYREHLGEGPEAYQDVIGGHEPCGQVVAIGPDVARIREGDRVVVYHISGCGQCDQCRRGYQISCTSPRRAAYGWQRDGGHADLLLAQERDLLVMPDSLSYLDGACVACGGATAYEALCRVEVSGRDEVLVTGLGPVGLMAGMFAKAMGASRVVGTDPSPSRRSLATPRGAVDEAVTGSDDELGDLLADGAEVALDCSGEGGRLAVDVSEVLIHRQLTVHGSWVSSTWRTDELLERLARWDLHPERVVTDRFALSDAGSAYATADTGADGKVAITWP